MPSIKFTAAKIKFLEPVPEKQVDYFDEDLAGFFVRVSPRGRKSFGVMYRVKGRFRRLTIGTYPLLSLADARAKALEALREAKLGRDPAEEKQQERTAPTFESVALEYLEKHAKPKKKSWKEDERIINRYLLPEFGNQHAADITRRAVREYLERKAAANAPIMANQIRAIMRKIYNWAISADIVENNPVFLVPAPAKARARERVLTDDELRRIWEMVEADTKDADAAHRKHRTLTAGMIKLRILTAQRGGEIVALEWSELDMSAGWWTIPAEKSKNGLSHRVPLSSMALDVICEMKAAAGDTCTKFVFPDFKGDFHVRAPQKGLQRIQKATGIDFVGHDFRRTTSSKMTGMGIPRLTVAKILNHAQAGNTKIYDRHSYDAEKRDALELWAKRLAEIVGLSESTMA
jgi:integrase